MLAEQTFPAAAAARNNKQRNKLKEDIDFIFPRKELQDNHARQDLLEARGNLREKYAETQRG